MIYRSRQVDPERRFIGPPLAPPRLVRLDDGYDGFPRPAPASPRRANLVLETHANPLCITTVFTPSPCLRGLKGVCDEEGDLVSSERPISGGADEGFVVASR